MMTASEACKRSRLWHLMAIGQVRIIKTLTTFQIQSQLGKVRSRRPECKAWRWKTVTLADGSVEVRRVT